MSRRPHGYAPPPPPPRGDKTYEFIENALQFQSDSALIDLSYLSGLAGFLDRQG